MSERFSLIEGDGDEQELDATGYEAGEEVAEERPLRYLNAEAWVQDWLLPHYRRNPATHKWDPAWWQYEEAGTVLEALWESWEQMRWEDATTTVAWFRDYLYPVMDRLTAPDGPFWAYDPPQRTDPPDVWSVTTAPQGWFGD